MSARLLPLMIVLGLLAAGCSILQPGPTDTPPAAATTTVGPSAAAPGATTSGVTPVAASATPGETATRRQPICTPPPCGPNEDYYCPGDCPGGCGTICATATAPGGASPSPTRRSAPTRTATPGGPPVIHYLQADVPVADPGQTITLEWSAVGGESATLYHLAESGQLEESWTVPPIGSLRYTIITTRRNWDGFMLAVSAADGQHTEVILTVPLTCPDSWFFEPAPESCPSGPPLSGRGAEQEFENGRMIWVAAEDLVYVLFDDGQSYAWEAHTDEWDEGEPESDPSLTPPPGLLQPVRGFGLVWREAPQVRERLGWATEPEHAYPSQLQRTAFSRYNTTYIRALDGGVWVLKPERSDWEHLP